LPFNQANTKRTKTFVKKMPLEDKLDNLSEEKIALIKRFRKGDSNVSFSQLSKSKVKKTTPHSDLGEQMSDWEAYKHAALYSEKNPTLMIHDYSHLKKLDIVFMGDEHIGSSTYQEGEHRSWVNWCLENKIPIILMGDELECATRDSIGAGVYESEEIIDQQLEHFYQIYKPLAEEGLILGIHIGNHESRLWKSSGVNLSKIIAKELKIPYLGIGKLHYFKVGKERYTIYTTHGATGSRLPHTKMKGCLDLANMIEAEIYAMGHTHGLQHHVREYYTPDFRNKVVRKSHKHFILTGSFLSHWGSYGHVKNYEPMQTGCPRLKLQGEIHQVRVSLGARDEQPEYAKPISARKIIDD
jgi:hypothetical protein